MESPNDDDKPAPATAPATAPAAKPGRARPPLDHPDPLVTRLEAAAFRSLVEHLRLRSDDVSNMELMTTAGFCRNCLAKVRKICGVSRRRKGMQSVARRVDT
jgi:hypothetical protein